MKTFLNLLLFTAFVKISFSQTTSIKDSAIQNQLRSYVYALADDSMQGRSTGSAGMYKAAYYIANEMESIGLKPLKEFDQYFQQFDLKIQDTSVTSLNIIGAIPGDSLKHELVIFCAHYDHIGKTNNRNGEDSVYNGANDNASGVAGVLTLASQLINSKPRRTILFIFFSGEESGLLGSSYFASQLLHPDKVISVINFDMIGRGSHPFFTGSNFGNLFKFLNTQLKKENPEFYKKPFFSSEPYQRFPQTYFYRSDNFPFANKKIPAHTIMVTKDDDIHYHQLSDEANTLDYEMMAMLITAVKISVLPIIEGTFTPKRIKL